MSNWRIPLCNLDYGIEEETAVLRVLRSQWLSTGPEVEAFEREFAEFLGVKHAIAVANGTAALHLAFRAVGLGEGDEVIQPAINFVAAANSTVAVAATPKFADVISLDEPTIDPAEIERLVTSRTKAAVVMHYGGYLCRMAEINAVCQRNKIALVEDACHAVGAKFLDPQQRPPDGQMAGSIGDVAAFSFFSNKNMATGEGGMVATNNDGIAKEVRLLRSHGMTSLSWDRYKGHARSYEVVANGFNYRLDELRAALGRVQLNKLRNNNYKRGILIEEYKRNLSGVGGWDVVFSKYYGESAFHLMVALAPSKRKRDEVVLGLENSGVQTSLHYPFVPHFEVFRKYANEDLTNSLNFVDRAVSLPLFPGLTLQEVEEICSIIAKSTR